jgi:hypothetical protein
MLRVGITFRNWCYSKILSRDWAMKEVLTLVEEEQFMQYLLEMSERELGLSPTQLKMKVYEITKTM